MRTAEVKRTTGETDISLSLCLDGSGKYNIDTGIGFLDHMLCLFTRHGGFDLDIVCKGDTNVDDHHSAEDIGIALGNAFKQALGHMKGIGRYGDIILPMDETLMMCAADVSGRGYLGFNVSFPGEKIGTFDTELVKEFFLAFARESKMTLHFRMLEGENSHHIAEACFKAFGRVMAKCVNIVDENGDVPSTKGVL